MKSGIPDGKHGVAQTNGVSHDTLVRVLIQVRLSSLGIDVRMGTEEGHECAGLVPSDQHFGAGVAKEASDIGCVWKIVRRKTPRSLSGTLPTATESHATDVERQQHRGLSGHVVYHATISIGNIRNLTRH